MAKIVHRVAAAGAAILFLATSLGFGAFVIWQQTHQAKTPSAADTQAATNQSKEGKLEGTKLANFTPVASIPSLQKIDTVVGTGTEVKAGDTVTAHYTGAIAATGQIFESSHDIGQAATFPLSGVIQGWQEGVPGMKVGGKRRLLIPAAQAYGAQGSPPKIGPNADLVFDIELVKIGK